ncbi:MAG: ATP-binding protein, partial [Bacteroidota bacterium]
LKEAQRELLKHQLNSAGVILIVFPETHGFDFLINDLEKVVSNFLQSTTLFVGVEVKKVAQYLFRELSRAEDFIISQEAGDHYEAFVKYLKSIKATQQFETSVRQLKDNKVEQFELIRKWVQAFMEQNLVENTLFFVDEVAGLLFIGDFTKSRIIACASAAQVAAMQGSHPVLSERNYVLDYHAFFQKMEQFQMEVVPQFEAFQNLKKTLVGEYKQAFRLDSFKPRVLSSFVRNKLIDQVYLPIFGDNLAKQIGVAGEKGRTDRMGMLLLISPPGYGKTTLMEYIADRLGLIFIKVNGPTLGHQVTSLDPTAAPNLACRQELEKLNLALEMGNNVMFYLDDIQHCHPEFLQKFISLCDAQRKIEGVFKGQSKTYDLRGKRFCVIMAGNPYTEQGDKFQIPDMLANRADIYNLGDIIGDAAEVFKLSYIENALTSNPVLQQLATKSSKDVHTLLKMMESGSKEGLTFEANHAPEEIKEYVQVLEKLIVIRDTVLKVNQEYIRSAAIGEDYRTEPAFKLQGSYRDMNKLAEKVVPIMNDAELQTLIFTHYESEAQTLTSSAEANFLKLKELIGALTEEDALRWKTIQTTFEKNKIFRKVDGRDPMAQVLAQLSAFTDGVEGIKEVLGKLIDSEKKT